MMVRFNPSDLPSADKLATALREILDYINPLIEANPDAQWQPQCSEATRTHGNHDEAFREGQENAEAYTARKINDIITKAFRG